MLYRGSSPGTETASGADPGFPVGGSPTLQEGDVSTVYTSLPDFPKNCMKLRKFWSVGVGGAPGETPPLDPPLSFQFDYRKLQNKQVFQGHVFVFVWYDITSVKVFETRKSQRL